MDQDLIKIIVVRTAVVQLGSALFFLTLSKLVNIYFCFEPLKNKLDEYATDDTLHNTILKLFLR